MNRFYNLIFGALLVAATTGGNAGAQSLDELHKLALQGGRRGEFLRHLSAAQRQKCWCLRNAFPV